MSGGGGGALKYVRLGATGIEVPEMGVGAWQWGDAAFWGYGKEYGASTSMPPLRFAWRAA